MGLLDSREGLMKGGDSGAVLVVGVKGGIVHGKTDEYGGRVIENEVHVHDFHATILHLLGFDQ